MQKQYKNKSQYIDVILKEFAGGEFYYSLTPQNLGNDYSLSSLKIKKVTANIMQNIAVLARLATYQLELLLVIMEENIMHLEIYNVTQSNAHAWVEVWLKIKDGLELTQPLISQKKTS